MVSGDIGGLADKAKRYIPEYIAANLPVEATRKKISMIQRMITAGIG